MKFNIIYLLVFLCKLIANQERGINSIESLKANFESLGLDGNRCIEGKVIILPGKFVESTENYDLIDCNTLAPICGIISESMNYRGKNIRREMRFGCFPANEIKTSDKDLQNDRITIHAENFFRIYMFIKQSIADNATDYFFKNRPNNNHSDKTRYDHENRWVENPSEHIFNRMNASHVDFDSYALSKYFNHGEISLFMLLYIIFICVSVIFKLLWLVIVAWKSMKQGYEPIKQKDTKNEIEETVEELD